MSGNDKRVGDAADAFLEKLLMAEKLANGKCPRPLQKEAWSYLSNSDFHFIDPLTDELDADQGCIVVDPSEQARALWPIDYAKAHRTDGDKLNANADDFFLVRIITASPSSLRGKAKYVLPKNIIVASAAINADRISADVCYAGLSRSRWSEISNAASAHSWSLSSDFGHRFHTTISFMFSQALNARYSWHAAFAFSETSPRLLVPTNPKGCLDLFKSRLLNPGEKRRSALRHWVNNHYRQRSDDPEALSYVRDHLRGNTRFIWNGLDCELLVSEYDLERNEFFREQASEWRSQRKHNRKMPGVKDGGRMIDGRGVK